MTFKKHPVDAGHWPRRSEFVSEAGVLPDGGEKHGKSRLAHNLQAEVDEDSIEVYRGVGRGRLRLDNPGGWRLKSWIIGVCGLLTCLNRQRYNWTLWTTKN